MARPHLLFAPIVLALGCGPDPAELARARADAGAMGDAGVLDGGAPMEVEAAPRTAGEGTITRVVSRELVPLKGYRVDAKPGDYLIVNAGSAAVVSNERGTIIDLGAVGGVDGLVYVDSTTFGSMATERMELESISVTGPGDHVLRVTKRLVQKPLWLDVFITFAGDLLKVESVLRSRSDEPVLAETLGEIVGFGNVPTWIEGHGFASSGGTHPTDFLARESLGVAYALGSDDGRTLARFGSPDPAGFHESAQTGERTLIVPARGLSERRVISVAHSTRSLGDAAQALPFVRGKATERFALPLGLPEGTVTEISGCEGDNAWGKPYARFGWASTRVDIAIPQGCFGVRFTRDGHAPGPWTKVSDLSREDVKTLLPRAGRVRYRVVDAESKALLPARIHFKGIRGSKDPSFGEDPDDGAALNTIYTRGEGERALPPGQYRVSVHRGLEYSTDQREITMTADGTVDMTASIERVVATPGWMSADLHVHAVPSPDAPSPLADRVMSLAGAGVEVAVATDHNAVTDYGPTIRALALEKWIASIVGDEVTTREPYYGHFNVFPLRKGAAPVPWKKTTPTAMFAAARALAPEGQDMVVQVNHPRMGDIGYFDLLRLDVSDVQRWRERSALVDTSFDALEVFNGDHYANIPKVELCLKDWYALVKAGLRVTATGNSDSHKISYHEAGVPQNWVRVANDDPAAFDSRAFVEAVRAGRVVVSSGPFVRLTVDEKEVGDTVAPGPARVRIRVDAAPWIDVDAVDLLVRGEVVKTWSGPFAGGVQRFDETIERDVVAGDFITVIARGSKPMLHLHRWGAKPFAFTNPIWVR